MVPSLAIGYLQHEGFVRFCRASHNAPFLFVRVSFPSLEISWPRGFTGDGQNICRAMKREDMKSLGMLPQISRSHGARVFTLTARHGADRSSGRATHILFNLSVVLLKISCRNVH